jgi:Zn-dependent protease with chaperone function
MLALEIGGAGLGLLWGLLLVRDLLRSHQIASALSVDAHEIELFGVACLVTPALGSDAIVVGSGRPRIFVGETLMVALSQDELKAVIYHEDHHRRTRAPLRAAALGAWLPLLGRSESVRGIVRDRLADLETLADADAIRRGSSPRSLASALLKGDTSLQPVAFSYAADRRVERLLDRAAGIPINATSRLPYEWLPVVLLAVATLGCHVRL